MKCLEKYGWLLCVAMGAITFATAQNIALLPSLTPANVGDRVKLEWDASSGATGYNIYATSNKVSWRKVGSTTNAQITLSNVFLPQWWHCRAVAGTNESIPSNTSGWLSNYDVLTVNAESSSNLTAWKQYAQVYQATNPSGMNFFRTAANLKRYRKLE